MTNPRVIAIDWSGRSGADQGQTIWLAEAIGVTLFAPQLAGDTHISQRDDL
jgi:hypothetical protein